MSQDTPTPPDSNNSAFPSTKKKGQSPEEIVYEHRYVKVVRGFEAKSRTKWERDGWEFLSEEQGMAQTTLSFRREKPKLSKLGILSAAGFALVLVAIITVGAINEGNSPSGSGQNQSDQNNSITEEPSPEKDLPTDEPTLEPEITEEPEPVGPVETLSQSNARSTAEDYINSSGFSRSGLIDQLKFEGYSTADATYAVDAIEVDWNEQAARTAQAYLDSSSFSRSGLYDQLIFEGYTSSQANFGLGAVGY
jgi:hypothetical protein